MTSVTSRAQQYSQRKLRLKRWVFRRLRKTGSDCADVTWCGRLFRTRDAATGKARSPYVDSRVRRTTRDGDEAEHRRRQASTSAVWQRSTLDLCKEYFNVVTQKTIALLHVKNWTYWYGTPLYVITGIWKIQIFKHGPV